MNRETARLQNETRTPTIDFSPNVKAAIALYDVTWRILMPFLRLNQRLTEGWDQRRLKKIPARADLWLHAASAGEVYLVREIVNSLIPANPVQILVTTNTSQGMMLLSKIQADLHSTRREMAMAARYFPFDRPTIMESMVDAIGPRLVVLMETELWPGLLTSLKARGVPTLIINGRINSSSFRRYRLWPTFWRQLAPDRILAISPRDADSFGRLFEMDRVTVMPNIKFDQWYQQLKTDGVSGCLNNHLSPDSSIVVFGSVRQEEEKQVRAMIGRILSQMPKATIALFPRHMSRLSAWREYLNQDGLAWATRSRIKGRVKNGTVVLWDTFGELRAAYEIATAAFVGGSLAPLGGQNFLEPLGCGIIPVIGPSWHNFHWIGETIFEKKLVVRTDSWEKAASQMIATLKSPPTRETVRHRARTFARNRTGGTRQACRLIENLLTKEPQA